jgi:tRNA-dihydrouridine synthase A
MLAPPVPLPARRFHVAPMQGFTGVHLRQFFSLLSSRATLWTEMEKTEDLLLSATAAARRLSTTTPGAVLQLGGSDPKRLAQAAKLAGSHHFSELNLNCGCPSIEAGGADFGAALMLQPSLVAACVTSLAEASSLPVSVKCRVAAHEALLPDGALPEDKYELLHAFVSTVAATGCLSHVVLHARAAVLTGLSPAKNRQVPALRYYFVEQLAADFPRLRVTLNGGVRTRDDVKLHLADPRLAGVMVGRWMLRRPLDLHDIDVACLHGGGAVGGKEAALWRYGEYAAEMLTRPGPSELAPVLSELLCPLLLVVAQLQDDWKGSDIDPPPELSALTAAVCNASARVLGVATRGEVSIAQVAADDAGPASLRRVDKAISAACGKKVHAKLLRSRREA